MSFHRPTLRHEARQAMRTAHPRAMLVTLVYLLLTSGLSLLVDFFVTDPVSVLTVLTAGYYLGLAILLFMAVQILSLAALWIPGGAIILVILPFAALAIYFYRVILCSMSVYCLLDEPESGALHALRRSFSMMKGHVKDYLLLHLSFWVWYLLSFLSSALATTVCLLFPAFGDVAAAVVSLVTLPLTLWLTPYIATTECKFYDCLIDSEQAV